MENNEPSPRRSGNDSWRIYFWAVLVLVGSLVVMNVTGLRMRDRPSETTESASSQSIRAGDFYIRQSLLPVRGIDTRDLVRRAVRSYREAGTNPAAIRRIGVARQSLLNESAEADFRRLAAVSAAYASEVEMWRRIYSEDVLSTDTAGGYINRIEDLDLGPLTQIAVSDVYRASRQPDRASATREAAERTAVTQIAFLAGVFFLLSAAGIAGIVLGWIFFAKHANELNRAPAPRIQPTVLLVSFLVYFASYILFGGGAAVAATYLSPNGESALSVSIELVLQILAMFGALALAGAAFFNMIALTRENAEEVGFRSGDTSRKIAWGLGAYCVALPLVLVSAYISQLLSQSLFRHIDTPEHPIIPRVVEGGLPLLLSFVVAVIAAPIVEEIVFRGFLYTALRGRMGVWAAAAVSSAVFAAVHPTLPDQFLPLFVLAMVLAIVRERTGSLIPAIICHALHNAVTLLLVVLFS